jgi:hypothetical protein
MGKSRSTEAVLDLYPQVILHGRVGSELALAQVVWLKLECPHDGSVKGLCVDFFAQMDRLLGTDYDRSFGGVRRTVDELKPAMAHVASTHALGVLVIDEIQRLSPFKSGGPTRVIDFLVEMINRIGVPIVLIGTPKAREVLEREFRIIRRASGQGDLVWDRLREDEHWKTLVRFLWKYQYTREESRLSEEIAHALYHETQGIIDLAVKVHLLAQARAILSGCERVTATIVHSAAKDYLKMARPALAALRMCDARAVARFEDVDLPDVSEALVREQHQARVVELPLARRDQGPAELKPQAAPRVKAAGRKPKKQARAKQSRRAPAEHASDLRAIVAAGLRVKKAPYTALAEAGAMRPAGEFLEARR